VKGDNQWERGSEAGLAEVGRDYSQKQGWKWTSHLYDIHIFSRVLDPLVTL
jgi:hypothetical protein